jgi:hypothetical protein
MDPKAPTRRNPDEIRVGHLVEAIGRSAVVESSGRTTLVVGSGLDETLTVAMGEAIERTLAALARWVDSQAVALKVRGPRLEVGLFTDRESYEDYLVREGLSGLTGSLGMTHPVRCVSAVLASGSGEDLRVVAAHESIHLWVLRTGLCPAWHSWPRWLHEGFAQLWDHRATEHVVQQAHGITTAEPGRSRIEPNRLRQRDWCRIAASTDLERFLRRDMIADRRRHSADYATSWAVTYAMAHWGEGSILAELLHQLQVQDMQPYDGATPESHCLAWLQRRLGGDWVSFSRAVADLGRV